MLVVANENLNFEYQKVLGPKFNRIRQIEELTSFYSILKRTCLYILLYYQEISALIII